MSVDDEQALELLNARIEYVLNRLDALETDIEYYTQELVSARTAKAKLLEDE